MPLRHSRCFLFWVFKVRLCQYPTLRIFAINLILHCWMLLLKQMVKQIWRKSSGIASEFVQCRLRDRQGGVFRNLFCPFCSADCKISNREESSMSMLQCKLYHFYTFGFCIYKINKQIVIDTKMARCLLSGSNKSQNWKREISSPCSDVSNI